jgi:YhcH/YjgK/YiaL family protein
MKRLISASVITLSIFSIMTSCTQHNNSNREVAAEAAAPAVITVLPAGETRLSSLSDSAKVAQHINANAARWKAAFDYLSSTGLDTLAVGEYEILPDREVYAIVSEYVPKTAENCLFEAHKRYIDLQYIVSGKEVMGVTHASDLKSTAPYSDEKDIEFFEPDGVAAEYQVADSSSYYVFLPEDVHRPSMRCDDNDSTSMVKKVVLKIKY